VLERLPVLLMSGISVLSVPVLAAAQEAANPPDASASETKPTDESDSESASTSKAEPSGPQRPAGADVTSTEPGTSSETRRPADVPPPPAEPETKPEDWRVEVHGYFRAPMTLSISTRPNPDTPNGPPNRQVSYGPNRLVDSNYYSFAYTRLQEQDWAEITFHAKKKHVDAAVGWMGYWLAATGFRNPDSAAVPGVASLRLDTDFQMGGIKPNVALQMGAWWPGFGYFEKYDTFTLGRFRHIGEQVLLTVPVDPDLRLEVVQGFGTGRDGSFGYTTAASSPLYASKVGAALIAYGNLRLVYKKLVDVGLHVNNEWTRDPYLTAQASATDGKAYTQAREAHLSVVGAEANLTAQYAGHLWLSPSYISVKNGWALGNTSGTEVMHSQGGGGLAANYLGWNNAPESSTGSGSLLNFGFMYENTLSNVQGKAFGRVPDVKLSIFGLFTNANLDLPKHEPNPAYVNRDNIKQFKYGADVTVQALNWLALTLRGDTVNYDTATPAYIFSAITTRLTIASHFLSSESIYLQYSRYIYGDKMVLAGQWPWGAPLIPGNDVTQGGTYALAKPDMDVIKLQATVAF